MCPQSKAIILNDEERDLILRNRAIKDEARARDELRIRILKTALEYEAWLQCHGRGSSFSTFVDEFGFDENGNAALFKSVEMVRAVVYDK